MMPLCFDAVGSPVRVAGRVSGGGELEILGSELLDHPLSLGSGFVRQRHRVRASGPCGGSRKGAADQGGAALSQKCALRIERRRVFLEDERTGEKATKNPYMHRTTETPPARSLLQAHTAWFPLCYAPRAKPDTKATCVGGGEREAVTTTTKQRLCTRPAAHRPSSPKTPAPHASAISGTDAATTATPWRCAALPILMNPTPALAPWRPRQRRR